MPRQTGKNGQVILELQGTKKDFVGAWVSRLLQTLAAAGILWMCRLIYVGVMYLVSTLPPMQADVNALKSDVSALKESAATKKELKAAEERVKLEFAEELKKSQIITTTQPIPGR